MKKMRRPAFLALLLMLTPAALAQSPPDLVVGSKKFTENVLLAEIAAQLARHTGFEAEHRSELGGTRLLWNALRSGDIDVYPEYTGTLLQEIFAGEPIEEAKLPEALAAYGLRMTGPLGFNNTYALGMREERAAARGISTISDLREHPDLHFGFSNEFMDRGDGWPALRECYRLPQTDVRGVDHDLAYRGLEAGSIDVIDLYSTDAEIAYYGLRTLEDDRSFFPDYHAVYLYRADLEARAPAFVRVLRGMAGTVSAETMTRLNALAKIERVPETQVAAGFLREALGLEALPTDAPETWSERLWKRTREHLFLVGVSLLAAILFALPLGVGAAKHPRVGQVILAVVGAIYTVPSLALLVFMIPLFGIGGTPAVVALFLYSLLPIVRNTHAGLIDLPRPLIESAEALGLTPWTRLRSIEIPLAARPILAGIKTAAVINVGTATLGALIGAGGYGQPILTGIRLDDMGLILEGAVPAAALALLAQGLFEVAERRLVPKGLRLPDA